MGKNVYSVTQVNGYIRNMIKEDFLCSSIMIKGELSNVKYHGSGHIYFTLKDSGAAISCVMFASNRSGLKFRMEEGMQVIAAGNIDVYEKAGSYQLYAKQIEQCGEGALYEQFEKLKIELEEMGMFDSSYKQPIPKIVRRLGVVTAPTGAAVRDIIDTAKRRNPYIEIILYPAIVQGEAAVPSIINGIHALEAIGVDAMIVGRGGGSIEDLWAFNSREVAEVVFQSSVPVISAVGHETDTTIIDFVADLRAITPTAAAERAVCEMSRILEDLEQKKNKLTSLMEAKLERASMKVNNLNLRLQKASPESKMNERRMRIISMEEAIEHAMQQILQKNRYTMQGSADRLEHAMVQILQKKRHALQVSTARLEGLSPLAKLQQGYAFALDGKGKRLQSVSQVSVGDAIDLYLTDGSVKAQVLETTET